MKQGVGGKRQLLSVYINVTKAISGGLNRCEIQFKKNFGKRM